MKSIAVLGLALAACASVPAMAVAQEAAPQPAPVRRHTIHHHFHNGEHHPVHRFEAQPAERGAAPVVAAPTAPPQAAPFGLAFPHIAPYPNSKGDEDGLSEDANDCNKGCVGGAPN